MRVQVPPWPLFMSERITLRNLEWSDRQAFYPWINDSDVIQYSISLFQTIHSKKDIDKWFRTVLEDKTSINKGILYQEKFVGYAGITKLNNRNNSGEYFLFIGDKTVWGKRYWYACNKEVYCYSFS